MIIPTLTKAEAESFKSYVSNDSSKQNRIYGYMQNNQKWHGEFKPLRDMGFDKFVLALYNGYEVEKDLEDEIISILSRFFDGDTFICSASSEIMEAIDRWNLKDGASTKGESPDLTKPKS